MIPQVELLHFAFLTVFLAQVSFNVTHYSDWQVMLVIEIAARDLLSDWVCGFLS